MGAYGVLLLTAAAMRLWDLGSRAMHHDESLHAYFSWTLSNGDGYKHDPLMHGPLQFEANAAIFFALGDGEFTARLIYVIAGTLLIALPFLFRDRLGRAGALVVAGMLVFSPTLFYFSRFARNDILVAFWTLGLVISMWRYMDEGKNRYLYIGALLLALLFATKETAYIVTVVLGLFLVLTTISRNWAGLVHGIEVRDVSPPEAIVRIGRGVAAAVFREVKLSEVGRSAAFLLLLFSLSLPLGAALVSLLQDTPLLSWSNLVLSSPDGAIGPIGAPMGGGLVIAGAVVVALLRISARLGYLWNWSVWWRCALIFWGVWVLLHSTFFTNMDGVGSGMWRSLGYWLEQQDIARGNQPWYYYFVITSIYEFLPFLFSVIAGVYYLRRRDSFGLFLVFWAVAAFLLFSLASEKMPWLMVNIALPLIVLAGKFLADVTREIRWRRLVSGGGLLLLAVVPLVVYVVWLLAFAEMDGGGAEGVWQVAGLFALLGVLMAAGVVIGRRVGVRDTVAFAAIPFALVLLSLTIRTGLRASYENGDRPVEMIVYTQSSPDIPRLLGRIEEVGDATGARTDVPINIDATSGFTWPWAWYLRDYTRAGYPQYDASSFDDPPQASVLVIHQNNQFTAHPVLQEEFKEGVRLKHRWWFPEHTYRNLTPGEFFGSFVDRGSWRAAMDYFLHRELSADLGSEDSFVYFSRDVPVEFTPTSQQ